jgi:hypothetical protein
MKQAGIAHSDGPSALRLLMFRLFKWAPFVGYLLCFVVAVVLDVVAAGLGLLMYVAQSMGGEGFWWHFVHQDHISLQGKVSVVLMITLVPASLGLGMRLFRYHGTSGLIFLCSALVAFASSVCFVMVGWVYVTPPYH